MTLTIAFEGLPGVGKTTAISAIVTELDRQEITTKVIDLDSHRYAPALRQIADDYPIRLLLLWTLRLLQPELIQALKNRVDVILLDRFWCTTLAYDVYGHRVPSEFLYWIGLDLSQWRPDITLLLDTSLETIRHRQISMTLTDQGLAWRVKLGYLKLARIWSWSKINADQPAAAVAQDCLEKILSELKL